MNKIKNIRQIILILVFFISNALAQEFWNKLPGPEGGWVWSSAIDTTGGLYDGTIFIGTYGGGIFRSTDNGNNWVELNIGVDYFFLYDLTVGSSVFAATSEGLFRSDDNGETWQLKQNGISSVAYCFTLYKDYSNTIYAGHAAFGVFYSTDNGENWVGGIGTGLTEGSIRCITKNSAGEVFVGGPSGIFRSSDNGQNWTQINNGLNTGRNIDDLAIFYDASANENIIAATGGNGVYISSNNGDLWQQSNNGLYDTFSTAVKSIINTESNELFIGTANDIFKSTDYGNNWLPSGLFGHTVDAILLNRFNEIIAGTNKGNFRSSDTGSTWDQINNGFNSGPIFDLDINSVNDIYVIHFEGVSASFDNGYTWHEKDMGLADTTYYFDIKINQNDNIFVGTDDGIYRSDDNGENWIFKGLLGETVYQIEFNNNDHIFAGTSGGNGGLYRSENNGDTWVHLNNLTEDNIQAIAINLNDNTIFAGDYVNGVFRSTDNGDTWIQVNNNLTSTGIRSLAINASGDIFVGTIYGGVFRSQDNGDNWVEINNGLLDDKVYSIYINAIGHIYIGTYDFGIFFSNNNGDDWMHVSEGIFYNRIYDLAADHNDFIIATTDNGVYKSLFPSILPNPLLSLPANQGTDLPLNPTLEWYSVPGAESYHLQVSDVNDFSYIEFEQGGITDNFQQISGLNTGTNYYWRVRAENFTGASGWSGEWSFTTFSYPQMIDLISPSFLFPTHTDISNYVPEDYEIVGVPGRIDNDMGIDQLIGGVHKSDWQAYLDNGANNNYFIEFNGNSEFVFGNGRAFWVINKGNLNINKTGVETAILDSDGDTEIQLHNGWNLITNPFHVPLPWWQVQQSNNIGTQPIYSFNGSGGWRNSNNDFTEFEPYIGYYFDSPADMTLIIPYIATLSKPTIQNNYLWQVNVRLNINGEKKSSINLGISENSDPNRDNLDYRKPRVIGSIPDIYFYRPQWDEGYGIFASDMRPEIQDVEEWDFTVSGTVNKRTTIVFSGIEDIPVQHGVYLIDEIHSAYVNLREKPEYSFIPVTKKSNFSVFVGNQEMIQKEIDNLMPTEFKLGKNFPNPFNPSTTIPVSLPEKSDLTLKVYNVLGQEIKTIFDGTREAGKHYFRWDGTNYLNQHVAAGIYLYRMNTDKGRSFVGKMVLVK